MSDPFHRLYPELAVGGYTREDKTVEFYGRVDALLTPESTVVDFGAGRGGFADLPDSHVRRLQLLRGRVAKVIGVDVDPVVEQNDTIDEAVVWEPGSRLPLADASVDLVVSDYTFEHVENPNLVVPELGRILKPGGWICARTPNKWGYIGMGARAIPNRLHARVLQRAQSGHRHERDVFPTRYRLNTLGSVRDWFPEPRWRVVGYTVNGEPVYFGHSRALIYTVYGVSRVLPQRLGAMYLFFIQKLP